MNTAKTYRLPQIMDIIGGGTPKTNTARYWNGSIPWITVADMSISKRFIERTEKHISEAGLSESSTKILSEGDLIISARGTVGVVNQIQTPMAFNQTCYGLRPNRDFVDDGFFYYLMLSTAQNLKKIGQGGVFNTITKDLFNSINVSLPPIEHQKKIASVLWAWDRAIDNIDKLISAKQKLKQALMQKLLTGQVRFPAFGKPGNEFGDVPEGWRKIKLSKVSDIIMGSSPASKCYNTQNTGLPLIQGNEDISNDETSPKRWTSQVTRECQHDDIIMTVRAPVGEIAISKHHACIGRGVCAFRPKTIDKQFLYYLLKFISNSWISLGQGSTFTCLNRDDIANLSITIPEIAEQKRVGEILEQVDHELKTLASAKDYYNSQRLGLMTLFFE